MTPQERHTLLQEAFTAFGPHYQAAIQQAQVETGFQSGDWFLSFLAYGRDPQPLTAEFFNSLFPYTHIDIQRQRLARTAEHGFLVAAGADAYRLTELGRGGIERFYAAATSAISQIALSVESDSERLAELLHRVVSATITAEAPAFKGQLLLSHSTDPGDDAPAIVRIDQYSTDLLRYRDDAHVAAWQAYEVDGLTWETLTFVWQERAQTAAALAEQLANRGHDKGAYGRALAQLTELGWLSAENGRYQITEKGRQLREAAEAQTETNYLVGWSALSADEQSELERLLLWLKKELEQQSRRKGWQLAGAIPAAWFPLFVDKTRPAFIEQGLNKPGYFFILWAAHSFRPEPMSVANMSKRFPYYKRSVFEEWFAGLVEDKFLASDGDGDYYLTDAGRQAIFAVDSVFAEALGELTPLPAERLEQIVTLLGRVSDAALAADEPADKWSLVTNRATHRGAELPILLKLDQYFDDLAAFRDDVHLAAFRDHDVDGYAWELLTFIWRDGLNTPAKLTERLSFRGYDESATEAVLDGLVEHGWLLKEKGGYLATDTARRLREEAEKLTDDLFYAPWESLNSQELAQLTTALEALHDSLNELAADKAAAERADLYPLTGQISRALYKHMSSRVASLPAESGLKDHGQLFNLFRALSFEPDPISPNRIGQRNPYSHPARFEAALAELAEGGFLTPGSNGESGGYRLTDAGRTAVQQYLAHFRSGLDELDILTGDELTRLAGLLDRVINSALSAPTPPGALNLSDAHKILLQSDATGALARIDQSLDELNAFRDDAHLAAFQPLGVSGHAWEAFTLIWSEKANTATTIAEKLAYRKHTAEAYETALTDLVNRGWLTAQDGLFALSENGRQVREAAEKRTERYFYAPWTALNAAETDELRDLLTHLEAALQAALPVTERA